MGVAAAAAAEVGGAALPPGGAFCWRLCSVRLQSWLLPQRSPGREGGRPAPLRRLLAYFSHVKVLYEKKETMIDNP